MNQLKVRLATPLDIDNVASLFDEYRQFYDQESDLKLAKEFISRRIDRNESIIYMAKAADDTPAGFCQLYPSFCSVEAIPIYVLYDLYVSPNFRRSGVARELMLTAEYHARINQIGRMDLTTAKTNSSAQALYESLGWLRDEVFLTYSWHPNG